MQFFTIPQVCQLTGVNAQSLRNWVTAGLVTPTQLGTTGTGKGHLFSLVQVLAIAAGVRYRRKGASSDRMVGVVHYLATRQLEWLEAELAAGRTFPVPSMLVADAARAEAARVPSAWVDGMMVVPPKPQSPKVAALMKQLYLPAIYAELQRKIAQLSKMPVAKGRQGRKRGLGSK